MTGWRIGYAAGPENVIRNMVKLQENVSACAATPCQVAAIEALEGPQDHLKYMVEQYRLRRDYVMKRISEIPGLSCHAPAGTFYAFIDISQLGMPCEEFAMKLLEERQVVVVPVRPLANLARDISVCPMRHPCSAWSRGCRSWRSLSDPMRLRGTPHEYDQRHPLI